MLSEFGRRGLSVASSYSCLLVRLSNLGVIATHVSPQSSSAIVNRNEWSKRVNKCQYHSEAFSNDLQLPRECIVWLPRRWLSSTRVAWQQRKAVTERKTSPGDQQLTVGKKVAEASRTVSYAGVILVGLGVIGMVIFTLGKELFSSKSPNSVYAKSLKLCKNNLEIQDCLGTPIKGYGEMTRRKRRRHVSHLEYSQDGVSFLRMKFYLEGPHRKGTVHLEMKENERGQYEYRYLFVELDGYPSRTIILEDNR